MNIFKINFKNKDILLVNINPSLKTNNTKEFKNYCLNYNNDQLISINVFDNKILEKLNYGLVKQEKKLLDLINKITNINLNQFVSKNFVVAKIIECEKVPNTHLSVCKVDVKNKILQIVCGAKNARKDLITVAALNNAILPNGILIKNSKLLGHESFGMLCSYKELNINKESSGIIELDKSFEDKIGSDFEEVYL